MTKISTAEAQGQFTELVDRISKSKERVVITRRGKELIALVPIEDVKYLEELEDRLDADAAKEALADYAIHGGIPWEDVKKELHRQPGE